MISTRFEARMRTALDGRVWWCVYDNTRHEWSTCIFHGKYRRKKDAEYAIKKANKILMEVAKE